MHTKTLLAVISAALVLSACSFDALTDRVNPYRIDVRQGNYVDQSMVAQLRRGMTREQVRFVLGTPLVVDVFREDRWDYVYLFQPGRGPAEQRVISVFFVDDVLDRVEGDVVAADGGEPAGAVTERSRVVEIEATQRRR